MVASEGGIWARADARVFKLMMAPGKADRKALAADRTMANAARQVASLRQRAASKAARDFRQADRAVEAEMRQRSWGKPIHVKAKTSRRRQPGGAARAQISKSAKTQKRAFRAYVAPLKDARGRVAITFLTSYQGFKSKNWRSGLSVDHARYILRADALEQPDGPLISNMGETRHEIADCWRALEEVEKAYRANAKVQMRIIWNLPHELSANQRHEMINRFCEREFARLGLPYVAAIHAPDPDGDQRNYHVHICFSTRPVERLGDHEWLIAQEKMTGLDDAVGLRRLRAVAAAQMNLASRSAGLPNLYTHQSYRDRGLNAVRQTHVGPARTAAYRSGEDVHVVAHNAERVARNEVSVGLQQANAYAHRLDVVARRIEHVHAEAQSNNRRQRALRAMQMRIATLPRSEDGPIGHSRPDLLAILEKLARTCLLKPALAAEVQAQRCDQRIGLKKLGELSTLLAKRRPVSGRDPQTVETLRATANLSTSTTRPVLSDGALTESLLELQLSIRQTVKMNQSRRTASLLNQERARSIELVMRPFDQARTAGDEVEQTRLARQEDMAGVARAFQAEIDEAAWTAWRQARRERRVEEQQRLAYDLLRKTEMKGASASAAPEMELVLADARAWQQRLALLQKARNGRGM